MVGNSSYRLYREKFVRKVAAEDIYVYHITGSGGISCEEKQIILDEHNRLRQLVALGQIHGQPSAANMMEMVAFSSPLFRKSILLKAKDSL